jgi:hypothetical protein
VSPVLRGLVLTTALACGGPLWAQPPAPAPCPSAGEIEPLHLYGLWRLRLWPVDGSEDQPVSTGALLFGRHPEYPGSVRGELRRAVGGLDRSAQVSGDVTDGVFNLDESDDGVSMSAVWTGEPQDCGRRFHGLRRPAETRPAGEPSLHFSLDRLPGWR